MALNSHRYTVVHRYLGFGHVPMAVAPMATDAPANPPPTNKAAAAPSMPAFCKKANRLPMFTAPMLDYHATATDPATRPAALKPRIGSVMAKMSDVEMPMICAANK